MMRATPVVYLSFFFVAIYVGAQECISQDLFTRGFSRIVQGEWNQSDTTWMNRDRLVYSRFVLDDYIHYRTDSAALDIQHTRALLGYQRYIQSHRPFPDIVRLEIIWDGSFLYWREKHPPRSMRADHNLTSMRLFYERHFAGPFRIESFVERNQGFRKALWNGSIGIGFYDPKIEWRWKIRSWYNPRSLSVFYDADTVYAPISNSSQSMEFSMCVKAPDRWTVSALYRLENENGRKQKKKRYASIADNSYSEFYGTVSYALNSAALFASYKWEIRDAVIYGYKNSLQYAKFNLPYLKIQEWMSGGRINIKKGGQAECSFRYQNGETHAGLIVDSWPFSGGLGSLLGVKNYSGLDGNWTMLSLQTKFRKAVGYSHILEPNLSLIFFNLHGVYRYRKQDAFFQVIERGKYSTDMNKRYLYPVVFYQYQQMDLYVSMQIGQLIPLSTDVKIIRNINRKTRGGLTFTINMGITGI